MYYIIIFGCNKTSPIVLRAYYTLQKCINFVKKDISGQLYLMDEQKYKLLYGFVESFNKIADESMDITDVDDTTNDNINDNTTELIESDYKKYVEEKKHTETFIEDNKYIYYIIPSSIFNNYTSEISYNGNKLCGHHKVAHAFIIRKDDDDILEAVNVLIKEESYNF